MSDTQLDSIKTHFQRRLKQYERISFDTIHGLLTEGCVDDDAVLRLLIGAADQNYNNLLFSIVHYLLLCGADHELSQYYPTLTEKPLDKQDIYPVFRDFCLQHAEEITELASKRYVQYTSLWRAASLLLAFSVIERKLDGEAIAMLDVGTSAGFLLLWDKFAYDYGIYQINTPDALLTINCEVRGDLRPPFPSTMPQLITRKGIDIAPIDVNDADESLWLQASIPPDQLEHMSHINQGIQAVQTYQPEITVGDGSSEIAQHAATLAPDSPICIVDNYVPKNIRDQIVAQCTELGKTRYVFQITMGKFSEGISLRLIDHTHAPDDPTILMKTNVQGRYIEWIDDVTADNRV